MNIFVDSKNLFQYIQKFKFLMIMMEDKKSKVECIVNSKIIILEKDDNNINNYIKLNKEILCKRTNYYTNILGKNFPGYFNKLEDLDENIKYLYNKIINNHNFYFNFTVRKKVLFVSNDITWNFYCGNTIWASNFIKILSKKNNIDFTILISRKLDNNSEKNIFDKELINCNFIDLLKDKKKNMIDRKILVKYINNKSRYYDNIIIRDALLKDYYNSLTNESKNKLIFVEINNDHKIENLKKINMTFMEYFKNKEKNKDSYIIPPLLFDKTEILNSIKKYDYCYVGTFHNNSGIKELCNYFSESKKTIIFCGKVKERFNRKLLKIKENYKDCKNIILNISLNGVGKKECDRIIQESEICIRIDNLHECLSSKILTYINFEKPIILQKTETHKYLFGNNYPLFLPKKNDISVDDLKNLFKKKMRYDNVKKKIKEIKNKLNPDKLIYNNYKI